MPSEQAAKGNHSLFRKFRDVVDQYFGWERSRAEYNPGFQAVAGVGIDWTFADETDVPFGTVLVRVTAAIISIGGMLITALMLGLTSGKHLLI